MSKLDELLQEFEQPKKPAAKDNHSQQNKLPVPKLSTYPKNDSSALDNRKGNVQNSNFPFAAEPNRKPFLKQPPKLLTEKSFDIDSILAARSNQLQNPAKVSNLTQPAKNSPPTMKKDPLLDLFNEDRVNITKNQSNQLPQKVTTNTRGKPTIDLNPDDFFTNNNNRDSSATQPPISTTKKSASNFYLGNSRYKPGSTSLFKQTRRLSLMDCFR